MTGMPKQTPSQTLGPFFAYGLAPGQYGYGHPDIAGALLRDETTAGEAIRIEGCIYDGAGKTVPERALAFEFDIVLRGRRSTPFETEADDD